MTRTLRTPTKLIVIHGWGGTFLDAIVGVRRLIRFESYFDDGRYYLNRRDGMVVRRLLQEVESTPHVRSLQKLAVSRLLASCFSPGRVEWRQGVSISEHRLLRDFAAFGIPLGAQARERRATQLEVEALVELEGLMPLLAALEEKLRHDGSGIPTEDEARQLIAARSADLGDGLDLLALLDGLRDLHETGGDLDTVASAVFYTAWLKAEAAAAGRPFVHGRDYAYVFVNYHEGLSHLAARGPAEVYMADLPFGALPDIYSQLRTLHLQDVHVARYEDHHPYDSEQKAVLDQLVREGLIGFCAMSGPLDGAEPDGAERQCGADMIYAGCIRGQPWDDGAYAELRQAAHAEDFVGERTAYGRQLTELIKGGTCKVALVQQLVRTPRHADFRAAADKRGWTATAARWRAGFEPIREALWDRVTEVTLRRPAGTAAEAGGEAMAEGSDMPKVVPKETVILLLVNAYRRQPGDPKVNLGRVAEHFAREAPEADYLFYCYGAGLMVTRRLNQADLSLNLGRLMPCLGGEGDGGHAGAAVCRPDRNAAYPTRLLGTVDRQNFGRFARYVAGRLGELGFDVIGTRDRSRSGSRTEFRKGGRRLIVVSVSAFLIGLLMLLFVPSFRPAAVRRSNAAFFPQLLNEPEAVDATAPRTDASEGNP